MNVKIDFLEGIMESATEATAQPSWIEEMGVCFLGERVNSFHLGVRRGRDGGADCAHLYEKS